MPSMNGLTGLYTHCSLPWGEKQESGENEQVRRLFKTFPPSLTDGVERAKSALYKAFEGVGYKFHPVRGYWMVPTPLVPRAEARYERLAQRVWDAVDDMGSRYEILRATAQANLGERFNPRDYPEWETLRGMVRVQLVSFTAGEPVEPPASALSFTSLLEGFRMEAYGTLVRQFDTLLKGMVYRLTEGKRFHEDKVAEFAQFLQDFSTLAVAVHGSSTVEGDLAPLQTLIRNAGEALRGTTPEGLKEDRDLRGAVGNALNTVGANLDRFMSLPVGSRRLTFTPDPE